jgi:hypothetical protein
MGQGKDGHKRKRKLKPASGKESESREKHNFAKQQKADLGRHGVAISQLFGD